MTEDENHKEKEVAFYSAAVGAWFTTNFEKDKHLLSVSSAGIGLLVTLATAVGVKHICIAIMYAFSVFFFLVCIVSVLIIFSKNAKYMEKVIKGGGHDEVALKRLDTTAVVSFALGIIFTLLVGVLSSIYSLQNKETTMNDKADSGQNTQTQNKSLFGAHNIKPEQPKPEPERDSSADSSSENNSNNDNESND